MTLPYQWNIDDDTSRAASLVSSSSIIFDIYQAIHSLIRVLKKVWILSLVALPLLMVLFPVALSVIWIVYVKTKYYSWSIQRKIEKSDLKVTVKNINKFYEVREKLAQAVDTLQKTISINVEPSFFRFLGNPLVDTLNLVNSVLDKLNSKLAELDEAPKGRFLKLQSHEQLRENRTEAYKYLV